MVAHGITQAIEEGEKQNESSQNGSRVERETCGVDDGHFHPTEPPQSRRQQQFENERQNGNHGHISQKEWLDSNRLVAFVKIDQPNSRNGQQPHKMYSKRQPNDKWDEQQPTIASGFIHIGFPTESQIKQGRHDQGGHGIDFSLSGIKPKRIGEGKGQTPHKGTSQNGHLLGPMSRFLGT